MTGRGIQPGFLEAMCSLDTECVQAPPIEGLAICRVWRCVVARASGGGAGWRTGAGLGPRARLPLPQEAPRRRRPAAVSAARRDAQVRKQGGLRKRAHSPPKSPSCEPALLT